MVEILFNKVKNKGFVVGISGGIDSAVTSTLACMTGLPTLCIQMPIYQSKNELLRSGKHIKWLNKFKNFEEEYIDLTKTFESFSKSVTNDHKNDNLLSLANSRSRLRMTTLYYYATLNNYLVVGTGNKVEDFGVGFIQNTVMVELIYLYCGLMKSQVSCCQRT